MADVTPPDPRRSLIQMYERCIQGCGVGAHALSYHRVPKHRGERLAHALTLCQELLRHLEEWKPGKIDRKISFIQGILWCEGLYSQSMLREHTRSLK
ncbi:hypothetical protein KBC59_02370 [Patescibacteria group bacterium]|nr:hypothetical protein [Patescibacteria group bacterium]